MTKVGITNEAGPGYDDLIAGAADLITDSVVVTGGADLLRGALLGRVTADGSMVLSLSAASDGSEDPVAVLAEDAAVDTDGDQTAVVYIAGEFNENKITFGTGHTAASVKNVLAPSGIYLKPAQKA